MKSPYRHDWLGDLLFLIAAALFGAIALGFALLIREAIAHWSH